MSTFSRTFLQELERRTVLSDLIRQSVTLKRHGREFGGLCPFHKEKTPSFTVNDDKGFYHCFGCGAHGDGIEFLQKSEGMSFNQAVAYLASAAGLSIEKATPEERRKEERGDQLTRLCEAASRWFAEQLSSKAAGKARDYLRQRAINEDSIRKFQIGFAPRSAASLRQAMEEQGFSADDLLEAGLFARSEDGKSAYGRFRNRIIFPIQDHKGRLCGFGGRILDGDGAKYINSPQTPIFAKSRLLYGFPQGLESARRQKTVVVVEGYLDVIALHQAGISHVIAPLGTALTEDHLHTLWRYADEPICCFDGDPAGRRAASKAAERALPILRAGRSLCFSFLPEGEDPDSFLRSQGVEAWKTLMQNTLRMADFLWESQFQQHQPKAPEDWAALHNRLYTLASTIQLPAIKREYLHFFRRQQDQARFSRTAPQRRKRTWRRQSDNKEPPFATPPQDLLIEQKSTEGAGTRSSGARVDVGYEELILLQCLFQPSLVGECAEYLNQIDFGNPDLIRLREDVLTLAQENPDPQRMLDELTQKGYEPVLEALRKKERRFFIPSKEEKVQTPEERLKYLIKLLYDKQGKKITKEVTQQRSPNQKNLQRHQKERLDIRQELGLVDETET